MFAGEKYMSNCESEKEKDENHGSGQRRRVIVESVGHCGRWKIEMESENTNEDGSEWMAFPGAYDLGGEFAVITNNKLWLGISSWLLWPKDVSLVVPPGQPNWGWKSTATRQKQLLKLILARSAVKSFYHVLCIHIDGELSNPNTKKSGGSHYSSSIPGRCMEHRYL